MRELPAVAGVAVALFFCRGDLARAAEGDGPPPVRLGVPRAHPQLQERLRAVRTIGVLEPRVDVFELGAGGHRTLKEEWSVPARKAIAEAFASAVAARGFGVKLLEPFPALLDDLLDIRLLYESVGSSILFAVYQQQFPAPVERFDYSLGDVSNLLDAYGVDALAIVYASDEVSSGGRKAAKALSTAAMALLGVIAIPRGGVTRMNIGLVDRSGFVVWFNVGAGSYDLRDANSIGMLVSSLLAQLPSSPSP